MAMRSSELNGGNDFDGTVSGCDAVDVGSCCHVGRRLAGMSIDTRSVRVDRERAGSVTSLTTTDGTRVASVRREPVPLC